MPDALTTCRKLLEGFIDPFSHTPLPESPIFETLKVENNRAIIVLRCTAQQGQVLGGLIPSLENILASVSGLERVQVILTDLRTTQPVSPSSAATSKQPPQKQPAEHRPMRLGPGGNALPTPPLLSGVKTVIAVASGKGGVGKSSTAVNLALSLSLEGLATGLMDADVHGPSIAHMLGIRHKPDIKDGLLQPVNAWGVKAMSIGMLVQPDEAMIWRGPMVMGAISQLLGDVNWGDLDVLVVDMPPGTGDAQLTLSKKIQLDGAIIVSTPQDIALIDARRALRMFEKTQTPILGIIENMAYFTCPHCHKNSELFGHKGARKEAHEQDVPFLGEIPLLAEIGLHADAGTPIVAHSPSSEAAKAYRLVGQKVATALKKRIHGKPPVKPTP